MRLLKEVYGDIKVIIKKLLMEIMELPVLVKVDLIILNYGMLMLIVILIILVMIFSLKKKKFHNLNFIPVINLKYLILLFNVIIILVFIFHILMFLYLLEEMEDIIYFTQIQLSIYMFFHMIKAINSLKNLIQDIKVILLTLLQLIMVLFFTFEIKMIQIILF